jgi:hypothetical protein
MVTSRERAKVRALTMVSLVMVVAAAAVRASAPSPFAPRVHVRWDAAVEDDRRAVLERRFSLLNGARRDDDTWEYDLADVAAASVTALVQHPDVADTHYIERETGGISADAPAGTTRLRDRRLAALVHSWLFDWFLLFWASSIVVSGVWLASDASAHD